MILRRLISYVLIFYIVRAQDQVDQNNTASIQTSIEDNVNKTTLNPDDELNPNLSPDNENTPIISLPPASPSESKEKPLTDNSAVAPSDSLSTANVTTPVVTPIKNNNTIPADETTDTDPVANTPRPDVTATVTPPTTNTTGPDVTTIATSPPETTIFPISTSNISSTIKTDKINSSTDIKFGGDDSKSDISSVEPDEEHKCWWRNGGKLTGFILALLLCLVIVGTGVVRCRRHRRFNGYEDVTRRRLAGNDYHRNNGDNLGNKNNAYEPL